MCIPVASAVVRLNRIHEAASIVLADEDLSAHFICPTSTMRVALQIRSSSSSRTRCLSLSVLPTSRRPVNAIYPTDHVCRRVLFTHQKNIVVFRSFSRALYFTQSPWADKVNPKSDHKKIKHTGCMYPVPLLHATRLHRVTAQSVGQNPLNHVVAKDSVILKKKLCFLKFTHLNHSVVEFPVLLNGFQNFH